MYLVAIDLRFSRLHCYSSFILVGRLSIRPQKPIKQEGQHPLKEGPANDTLEELYK
jgi:hypothetical protein